jgi:hypothetical protein
LRLAHDGTGLKTTIVIKQYICVSHTLLCQSARVHLECLESRLLSCI